MNEETGELTFEEAVAVLPDGDTINIKAGRSGIIIGMDYSREGALERIRAAKSIKYSGPFARRLGFGMAIFDAKMGWVHVETDKAKIDLADPEGK